MPPTTTAEPALGGTDEPQPRKEVHLMREAQDLGQAARASREARAVTSADGTRIAFERVGSGPAVILISGATADRQGNRSLAEALASELTVLNYDRRGRGGSGDTPPYALEREFEDIDALIAEAGGSAHLYGISSGGALALEAAAAGLAVDRLAVYEVPYNPSDDQPRRQAEYVQSLERAARSGPGARMEVFLRLVGMDDDAMAATRNSDDWPRLVAVEHTLAYDAAAMGTGQPPVDRLGRITVPTLVLTGAPEGEHEISFGTELFEAAARAVVAAMPSAEHRRLPGQTHMVDPQALAPVLAAFYRGRPS
jgi:pimeloyl-ACP methyl ester carboxylesterase